MSAASVVAGVGDDVGVKAGEAFETRDEEEGGRGVGDLLAVRVRE